MLTPLGPPPPGHVDLFIGYWNSDGFDVVLRNDGAGVLGGKEREGDIAAQPKRWHVDGADSGCIISLVACPGRRLEGRSGLALAVRQDQLEGGAILKHDLMHLMHNAYDILMYA